MLKLSNIEIKETKMIVHVTDEFLTLCQEIIDRKLSIEGWRLIESSDMFQSSSFSGGFDAIEDAFCFSYFDENGKEYWFQIDLAEVEQIVDGSKTSLLVRPAC
jgi:hypothetical protein